MKQTHHAKGFSAVEALITVLILAVIALGGFLVWHKNHASRPTQQANSGQHNQSQNGASSQKQTSTDPYSGWKAYCDIYRYCFKYPADWAVSDTVTATAPCEAGGVSLKSPSGEVGLAYLNANNKDGGGLIGSYTITSSYALNVHGQNLTLIGGYATSDGNQYPSYNLIDTPSSAQSLAVGQTVDLPTFFTDQGVGDKHCSGTLNVAPTKPLSLADAKNWFSNADTKSGLKILQSFYYQ